MSVGQILNIRVLGYADDAALAEEGRISMMTKRITTVADALKKEADMEMHMGKTFTNHVQRQEIEEKDIVRTLTSTPIKKIEKQYKHQCEYCARRFKTKAGMKIHMHSCVAAFTATEEKFEIERIEEVFGVSAHRWFLVRWRGYGDEDMTWEPERMRRADGCAEAIREFWANSEKLPTQGTFNDPSGAHRCYSCVKAFKRSQDLKRHCTVAGHGKHKHAFKTTKTAVKEAVKNARKEQQEALPHVKWGDKSATNCWQMIYLGSVFQADGDVVPDVVRRIAMAQTRAGQLRHVWSAAILHLRLRMRLYMSAVCSIMVYGAEGWLLTREVCRKLNGANAKMVARITGQTPKQEATTGTRTFDVVKRIRARRFKWLGEILRMDDERMVKKAVRVIFDNRQEGDLLMDVPDDMGWDELVGWVRDQSAWKNRYLNIRSSNISKWHRFRELLVKSSTGVYKR